MKKSEFARTMHIGRELEQINEASLTNMAKALSTIFSAIATADPVFALDILDQINEQREQIETLSKEREEDREKAVQAIAARLRDSIEFDEEDEED